MTQPKKRLATHAPIEIGLNAAIVSVANYEPQILIISSATGTPPAEGAAMNMLPYGPFSPTQHRTFEIGLRKWVEEQTGLALGYVEQLYTFGDRGRHTQPGDEDPHIVSIGYLALTRTTLNTKIRNGSWKNWYKFFPWEDWRNGKPEILSQDIEPRLMTWAKKPRQPTEPTRPLQRTERLHTLFGIKEGRRDEEKVLERFELLYEAGLMTEAARDGRNAAKQWQNLPALGEPMLFDHRRILATAMGRLRAKIKYRPIVFELMPEAFTLLDLQKTVEAIFGAHLHKQNFRRLVETSGLVEPTGEFSTQTGGRPAKLFRFRRTVLLERPAPGVGTKSRS